MCALSGWAAPGAAQGEPVVAAEPAPAPRPVGVYAGVEPGEAQPPPAYRRVVRRQRRGGGSVIVTWPGFTPLAGGGSRFFVQTTEPRVPELRIEQGRIVVVFPDTQIHLRNSRRWLETRFFDTPVLRGRLERRGRDMALVLHLRPGVSVRPVLTSEAAPGGSFFYVYVDFPPGDYLSAGQGQPAPPAAPGASVRPAEPPPAPAREVDPTLDAMDAEAPPEWDDE